MEGAGILLLLAAAHESALLATVLDAGVLTPDTTTPPINPHLRHQQLLTLFFLPAVGLQRTWDLRSYTGAALALATGRSRAYGYRHTERVLADLARMDAGASLTTALARWTSQLWDVAATAATQPFYLDGHKKPVYSDRCIPRGLVGRRGAILGCRHLTVLHDQHGHPLLALTDRGDTHLTHSVPPILVRFEASAGVHLQHLVVDREGMAAAFLQTLTAAGRTVTTLLRTNQYRDLANFTALGDWTPLTTDQRGTVVREVASAQFTLPVPTAPATTLPLQVALIRDHRVQVPQHSADVSPRPWDADLPPDAPHWREATWQPIAAPAAPTTAKLIPVVSTGTGVAAADLAVIYRRRWVAQENSFKDWLIPLGLDINHGYHKTAVENSEHIKRRTALETRLATLDRWARNAGERQQQASLRYQRRREAHRADDRAWYRMIRKTLFSLDARGISEREYQQTRRALCAEADAASAIHRAAVKRAEAECTQEYHKQRRYRQTQRRLLRELEDLNATERQMYVLDDRKDHVMTMLKVALVNLAMWMRDQWFPADYAHATWRRIEPFMRLTGRVHRHRDRVVLELRPFNDAALRRDLVTLCQRVTMAAPQLPDGRRLELMVGAGTRRCATAA